MPNPALDFTKVEALRKHMLLNTTQMAKIIGVSRVTYSGWIKGKPIRGSNDAKARTALRGMFTVLEQYQWPMPEIIAMSPVQRFNTLLELLPKSE
jgi:hypothetical protein